RRSAARRTRDSVLSRERVVVRIRVAVFEVAAFAVQVPTRGAGLSALRRDDDDAIGRVGSVQGGCRRTFDDFDVLDLVWIQVADAARVVTVRSELLASEVARH